jgi:hypothetical protein
MRSPSLRPVLLSLASVAAILVPAGAAQAGVIVSSAKSCDVQVFEQPFLPWTDPMNYVLAPAGTIEGDTSRWSLSGGAGVVAGNEPYHVHALGEASSLSLPAGSSAMTQPMCVGLDHPTLRFFAKADGASDSSLQVEVLFEDTTGAVHTLTIGAVPSKTAVNWQPSVPMPIVANLLPLLPGELTAVAFRFTPQGGNWTIDDVYVDPRRSN